MSFNAKSKYKWMYVAPGKEKKFDEDNAIILDTLGVEEYTGPVYKIRIGKLIFYTVKGIVDVFTEEGHWIGEVVGKKKDMIHFFTEDEINDKQGDLLVGRDYDDIMEVPSEYMGKNVRTTQFPPQPSSGKKITIPKALAPTLTSAIALNVAQMKEPDLTDAGVFGQPDVPDIQQLIRDVNKHDLIHGGDKPVTVIGQGRTRLMMGDSSDKPMMMKDLQKEAMRRRLIEDS
jgi:hypothetical protein